MTDEHPLPMAFSIPQGTVEKWLAMPERMNLVAPLTRLDLDNLFFAITSQNQAMFALQQCLIHYTQGKLEEANKHLAESQRKNIEGDNHMRMFMNAVMSSARTDEAKNG